MPAVRRMLGLLLLAALCVVGTPSFVSAEALPSQDDLHKLFTDAQYKPLLAQLNKILPLNGDLAKPYDKVDLGMLKVNTLIMLKQPQPAVVAAGDAVKNLTPTSDAAQAAQAHALQILVTAAPKGIYNPKAAGAKPMPLDTATRDDVLKALLTDRQADDAAKAKAAQKDQSVTAVVDVINHVTQTRWVELAVTQSDTDSQKQIDDLVGSAELLMRNAVPPMADRVKAIDQKTNGFTVVEHDTKNHINWGFPTTKAIPPADVRELKTDIANCNKIASTCDDFSNLSKDHADAFNKIAKSAQQTAKDASDLLAQFHIQ